MSSGWGEQAQAQYSDYLSYIISCHAQSAIYFQVTQRRDCSAFFSTPLQPVCHLAGLITCHPRCGYGKLENSFNLPTHSWSSTRSIAVSVFLSLSLSFCAFPILISSSFPFDNFVKMRRVLFFFFCCCCAFVYT